MYTELRNDKKYDVDSLSALADTMKNFFAERAAGSYILQKFLLENENGNQNDF